MKLKKNNKEKFFIQSLHKSTKREFLKRMTNNKVDCMKEARKFGKNFWDGNRKYGYGGYKYIKGRWKNFAKDIIKNYKLTNKSKLLDVGCGKGFLLKEIIEILPEIEIHGYDISKYAINNSHKDVKKNLYVHKAQNRTKYSDKYFDLVISLGTLHNLELFDLYKSIKEISRISKKNYIMVEGYRSLDELFNLQCWALTCNAFFSKKEWLWIFKETNYKGDYEFIYF